MFVELTRCVVFARTFPVLASVWLYLRLRTSDGFSTVRPSYYVGLIVAGVWSPSVFHSRAKNSSVTKASVVTSVVATSCAVPQFRIRRAAHACRLTGNGPRGSFFAYLRRGSKPAAGNGNGGGGRRSRDRVDRLRNWSCREVQQRGAVTACRGG